MAESHLVSGLKNLRAEKLGVLQEIKQQIESLEAHAATLARARTRSRHLIVSTWKLNHSRSNRDRRPWSEGYGENELASRHLVKARAHRLRIVNYTGHSNSGRGWSAIVSACLSVVQFAKYGDQKSGALWAVWTVVFIAFFALIIMKANRFDRATGWFVVVAGFTTCFVPGGLLILGMWNDLSDSPVLAMEFGTIALFGVLLLRSASKSTEGAKKLRA